LQLAATIETLPGVGTLRQLSQPFAAYGYTPAGGAPVVPAALPARVADAAKRVVYTAPAAAAEPDEAWATFTYRVTDGITVSAPGIVWLVPRHRRLLASHFAAGADGWSVADNGLRASGSSSSGGLVHEVFSRGQLAQYIQATDAEITVDARGGGGGASSSSDAALWRFVAPPRFVRNAAAA
jgi:hypothetical protein